MDVIVYGSGDVLNILIDLKFLLENYIRMYDLNLEDSERKNVLKFFE